MKDSTKNKKKYKVRIVSHGKTISAKKGDLLADKIQNAGINLCVYCNKKGLCGKCLVKIVKGYLPSPNKMEKRLLGKKRLNENYRLACQYRIQGSLRIEVPPEAIFQETPVLTAGIKSPVSVDPAVKKYYLKIEKPRPTNPRSYLELIQRYLGGEHIDFPHNIAKITPEIFKKAKSKVTAVVYKDHELLDVEPFDTSNENYGVALDVGTSTVVVELIDLNSGNTIDNLSTANSQVKYGWDVISRIGFAVSKSENLQKLRKTILEDVNQLIEKILASHQIHPHSVYEIVMAGNTVMNHLLLGIPVDSLAGSPYNSVFSVLPSMYSREIGFNINKNGKVYIVPNIKSFIGGDVSAGLMASNFINKKGCYLFIDLGTNGEIVLKHKNKITATSTAAGPAFEGMNMSCGMLAHSGAVYGAEYDKGIKVFTLNHKPPVGICGTGFIDLISIFLDREFINTRGTIKGKSKKLSVADNLHVTQNDIREMQLAIAAIKTGIQMMLEENHLSPENLDGIYLGGAFGNYINVKNTIKIGLLPPIDKQKVSILGNSSLAGAKGLMLSQSSRKKTEYSIKKIRYFSLASNPDFQQNFLNSLYFGKRGRIKNMSGKKT
ncbi:DUF4445 domain-containing protein [bacterium]|nr:DUF4445 domain-containing protein [bacterium]